MTSRRLFDSLAGGCVPVIVKNIGNSRTELALGNLPFHHTISWQSIAFFLLPRSSTLADRDQPVRAGPKVQCRVGEAAWLSAKYNNTRLISRMRHDAVRAFKAHMDAWGRPAGVADAVLREMAYILDEPPRRDLWSLSVSLSRRSAPTRTTVSMRISHQRISFVRQKLRPRSLP